MKHKKISKSPHSIIAYNCIIASSTCSMSRGRAKSQIMKFSNILGWRPSLLSYYDLSSDEPATSAELMTVASQRDCSMASYLQARTHSADQKTLQRHAEGVTRLLWHPYLTWEESVGDREVWRSLVRYILSDFE